MYRIRNIYARIGNLKCNDVKYITQYQLKKDGSCCPDKRYNMQSDNKYNTKL